MLVSCRREGHYCDETDSLYGFCDDIACGFTQYTEEVMAGLGLIAADAAEPLYGGTITLSMRNPISLNPLINVDETVDLILSLIFERLFILDKGGRPIPNPALLEHAEMADNASYITLTLHENIVWANNTPITANDVQFSINFLRNSAPPQAIYKQNVENISSVTVVNTRTVRINFTQPNAHMPYMLSIPIVPMNHYNNISLTHTRQMNPVGNGPFAMYSFTLGRGMVLSRNDLALRGRPYIRYIDVRFLDSEEADAVAVRNAVVDVAFLRNTGIGFFVTQTYLSVTQEITGMFDFIGFNFTSTIASNIGFRRAVLYSLPFHTIVNGVYGGSAVSAKTPISPVSWLYNADMIHPQQDRVRALEHLENGGIEPWFLSVRILVNEENGERIRIASILSEGLMDLGFSPEIVILPWVEFILALEQGDFDIFIGGYNLSHNPDLSFMFRNENANFMRYSTGELRGLLQRAVTAFSIFTDENDMIYAYRDIQEYFVRELPLIGLVFRTSTIVTNNRIQGVDVSAGIFNNIERWFLNE